MCTGTSKFHFQVREERVDGKVCYTFDTDKEPGPKLPSIQASEHGSLCNMSCLSVDYQSILHYPTLC